MSHDVPEHYRPRLCHVVKWSTFQGYGFNLHAEKGKAGQFIGKVDDGSPAQAAGLKEGDRIVEVNGVNIGNENHQQVVTRIKAGGQETRLLVVDEESDEWYKKEHRILRGDLPEVLLLSAKQDEDEDQQVPGHRHVNVDDEHKISDHQHIRSELEHVTSDHQHVTSNHQHVTSDNQHVMSDHQHVTSDHQPFESNSEHEVSKHVASLSDSPAHSRHSTHSHQSASSDDFSHRPRLCHLKFWSHFEGYGFNLHAEKDKPGQYIGLVDHNSPASTGGLRVNDRIIEVNGVNVEQQNHTDVIARIKAIPGETKLLVVDKETDMYYQNRGVTISSSMAQIEYIATPSASDVLNGQKPGSRPSSQHENQGFVAQTKRQDSSSSSSSSAGVNVEGLELNLTVAEMKERLKAKKKQDPRHSKIPFEQKYKEFQRM